MNYYAKAILATAIAGLGGIATGYADDTLTKGEFWTAMAAAATAGGAVFGVRNGPRPAREGRPE